MRAHTILAIVLGLATAATACGEDEEHHGGDQGAPAAPTDLEVEELDGGAHLTWTDNSDDETQFMVMRMNMTDGGEYAAIASPPFDTTQYHDANGLESGKVYVYTVHAMNDEGMSEASNEVEWTAP